MMAIDRFLSTFSDFEGLLKRIMFEPWSMQSSQNLHTLLHCIKDTSQHWSRRRFTALCRHYEDFSKVPPH